MKKFTEYMLTRYPLIWNTRAYIILPLLLVINLLFFLAGYTVDASPAHISDIDRYYSESSVSLSILLGVLIIIGWLVFYLRHNAFKSFLPLSPGHLIKEFGIILLVFIGTSLFMVSYNWGMQTKVVVTNHKINLAQETNDFNLAMHFLPFSADEFRPYTRGVEEDEATDATTVSPARPVDTTAAVEDVKPENPDTYSYLNYHGYREISYIQSAKGVYTSRQLDSIAARWLREGKRDSVAYVINRLLSMCKQYGGEYQFDVQKHVASIFSTPQFLIGNTIIDTYHDSSTYNPYIECSVISSALNKLDNARNGFWDIELLAFLSYWCFYCSIILFSFRITRIRTWFSALITLGVLAIILSLLGVAFMHGSSDGRVYAAFLLTLPAICFILASTNIIRKTNKVFSGICYLLSLWSLPVFFLSVVMLISEFNSSYYDDYSYNHNIRHFIRDNIVYVNIANFVFALLVLFFVMIPLVKKWQANPEE